MRIRLLRRLITKHADYAIGTIINYSKGPAEKLIAKGRAEKYTGKYPPILTRKGKMKTDFFKPKEKWQ